MARKPFYPGNPYEKTDGGLDFAGLYQKPPEETVDPHLIMQSSFATIVSDMAETPLQKKWKAFVDSCQAIVARIGAKEGSGKYNPKDPNDKIFCDAYAHHIDPMYSFFQEMPPRESPHSEIRAHLCKAASPTTDTIYHLRGNLGHLHENYRNHTISDTLKSMFTAAVMNLRQVGEELLKKAPVSRGA